MAKEYTHDQLVSRAARWLVNTYGCNFTLTEFGSDVDEIPDAIGWKKNGRSILVECKVSRADFLADQRKTFRMNPALGMGAERYYMAPVGLIQPTELPEGWGLLEVKGNGVKVVVPCRRRKDLRSDVAHKREMGMLIRAIGRVQLRMWPAALNDWLKIENKDESMGSMQRWVSRESGRAHQLREMGYVRAFDLIDLPVDEVTEEVVCPIHDCSFTDCECLFVGCSDAVYEEVDGVLYGRRNSLPLVQGDMQSTLIQ